MRGCAFSSSISARDTLASERSSAAAATGERRHDYVGTEIAIRGLCKQYGRTPVLTDINLDIPGGGFLTLLGPSGSGKTTLLMAIAGFIRPNAGSVKFNDTEVVRTAPHKRDLGVVFQNQALFPHMSVAENVAYPLRLRRVGRAEIERRVQSVLALVKLSGLSARKMNQLSGGQRQRVALARAIVFEPKVLLMDEPLSALDKGLREEMQIEIRNLHKVLRITTVAVTHDQQEALVMSDQIAVINAGRIAQVGTPRHIYERPENRFVANFIGESQILAVQVKGDMAYLAEQDPLKLPSSVTCKPPHCYLVLRPEKLRFVDSGAQGYNILCGEVCDVLYRGDSVLIYVNLSGGSNLVLRRPADHEALSSLPVIGQRVRIGLHISDTLIVSDE